MLAPLIVDCLIASLLLLAVGWVSDILHASTHTVEVARGLKFPSHPHLE
jgi:hypothetical protein